MFDSVSHWDKLRRLRVYVASAAILSSVGWKQAASGHLLVDKPASNEIALICVGKVLDHKLMVGPSGNYNPQYDPLFKAKFMFHLVRPDEPAWADDWDKSIAMLEKIQASVASTKVRKNMLDPMSKNL